MIVALYEDRVDDLTGLELALLSLRAHHPDVVVSVRSPGAGDVFANWFDRLSMGVLDRSAVGPSARGWDVKPSLLLSHLDAGHESVVWLDSDILTTGPWLSRVSGPPDVFVATQETPFGQAQGGTHRAEAWELPPGRALPVTINSGLLRVTGEHTRLLQQWAELLADDRYRSAQAAPWQDRPLHLLGDQEVLTALLGSADYRDVSIDLLRQGIDIAQCFGPAGFLPMDRLRAATVGNLPPLIHAMGVKPWEILGRATRVQAVDGASRLARLRHRYDQAHLTRSPYVLAARPYATLLSQDPPWWLKPGRPNPRRVCVAELPLAIVDSATRRLKAARGIDRYELSGSSA